MIKTNLLIFVFLIAAFHLSAQDSATVYWELSVNTAQSYITSGGVYAMEQTSTDSYVIRDYGGVETSQRVYSSGSGLGFWPDETSENMDRYCEFVVKPRNGLTFQLTELQLNLGNSGGSNNVRASIYYSTDGFETATRLDSNLVLPSSALKQYNYPLSDSSINSTMESHISLRIYPWLQGGIASGKYFNIKDVRMLGVTIGEIIPELPGIETVAISKISTQSAWFKGLLTDDGGVTIDSLGLVISTEVNADTSDRVILVSPETGYFETAIEALTPGQTYYVKAFAMNAAGIAYGDELTFTTLEKLEVPGVSTQNVSDLRPTGAIAHGTVFFDGGLDVSLTGFCFSQQVSPTLNHEVVEADAGLGGFSAYLAGLDSETTYYVRAFAQNEQGVGYGDQVSFITPQPLPDINMVVDQSGNGDYLTLQKAFNAIPFNYHGNIHVLVKKGIYQEKVLLEKGKINVHLKGEFLDSTIIRWDDYSGKVVDGVTLGTSTSYTIAIDADDFIAQNITFQNTSQAAQAVALRVKGDRMIFQRCNLLGYQDTYYTWGTGRVYHEDCYIEGTVDFIFGSSIAVFKNCTIKSLRNSPITAAATPENYKFGYVFMNCDLIADNISGASLGRPWKAFAKTVFIETNEGEHIIPAGWIEWSGTNNHLTAYYAEYNCSGEGFQPDSRASWTHQLTDEEAQEYTIESIFSKNSASPAYYYDWMPVFDPVTAIHSTPDKSGEQVLKSYPNPFNESATINYELDQESVVNLTLNSLDGRLMKQMVNGLKTKGPHQEIITTNELPSGVYVCRLLINNATNHQVLIMKQ